MKTCTLKWSCEFKVKVKFRSCEYQTIGVVRLVNVTSEISTKNLYSLYSDCVLGQISCIRSQQEEASNSDDSNEEGSTPPKKRRKETPIMQNSSKSSVSEILKRFREKAKEMPQHLIVTSRICEMKDSTLCLFPTRKPVACILTNWKLLCQWNQSDNQQSAPWQHKRQFHKHFSNVYLKKPLDKSFDHTTSLSKLWSKKETWLLVMENFFPLFGKQLSIIKKNNESRTEVCGYMPSQGTAGRHD